MAWQFRSDIPVYRQIISRLRAELLEGKYPADGQIPPVRQLAFEAAVNPNTMQRALAELEEEGLLYTRSTAGRFVTSDGAVLRRARETMHRETMERLISEALSVGITRDELITFLEATNNMKEDDAT